jgi:CheY-like chemotaxis protein
VIFCLLHKFANHFSSPPSVFVRRGWCFDAILGSNTHFLPDVKTPLPLLPWFSCDSFHFHYRVLEAINGVEALDVWNQHRDEIHLLLTDLVMPGGISGIELAGQLLETNPKLKVIYASGYSAEVASKDFPLKEGVNFLTKPFEAQKLAQTIRNILDKPA